ncbi:uncharacterized protein N7515_001939 [Penicillium bovifimosum]|uniref:Clock-controlled protein 6 n=1 Tax=Penicillium bovifimosum TaxID=126998 RepID=A0A9W9HAN3_9EURO|nr:uncharacterized protein N7515_001939 [Penicillium bovifimosum]KAJ5143152.1 hypothetical protein N7515_001939 [Penicillium bovifimosum]
MRFSVAAVAACAAGAMAGVVTETVTAFTTYCPEATSVVHGSHTYSISTPGHITMSHGPYTVTRPLLSSTVTECHSCSSSTPVIPVVPSGATSTPLAPNPVPTGASSAAPTPSQPAFNAGAVNAATGAGAGLAAVFGVVALLL